MCNGSSAHISEYVVYPPMQEGLKRSQRYHYIGGKLYVKQKMYVNKRKGKGTYWTLLEQRGKIPILCSNLLKQLLLYQAVKRNHPDSSGPLILGIDVSGKSLKDCQCLWFLIRVFQ